MISYEVIRSGRKTLSIEIRPDGSVLARAPYSVPDQEIASFIRQKEEWIGRKQAELLRRRSETGDIPVLTFREIQNLVGVGMDFPIVVLCYERPELLHKGEITLVVDTSPVIVGLEFVPSLAKRSKEFFHLGTETVRCDLVGFIAEVVEILGV